MDPSMTNFGVLKVQSKPRKTPYFASVLTEGVSRTSFSLVAKLFLKKIGNEVLTHR